MDNTQPFKKRKKWQFHYKWKRKRREEDPHLNQVTAESDSLKRPKRNDPDDSEGESPDPTPQTADEVPNEADTSSVPSTKTFFPIFSRKPLIYFKANPPKFNAKPSENEVEKPLKKKSKAKAKTKTETETTNKITNYFGGAAAAKHSDPP